MAGIFISYRRADSGTICGRIADSLRTVFGSDAVLRDVSDIPGGVDFRRSVDAALDHSKAVVALIGPTWATATDQAGQPRFENPEDPVRIEVESALLRRIPIIPVLVLGGRIPKAQELPPSIAQLQYLTAYEVHDDPLYRPDVDRLIQAIAYVNPSLPTDQSHMQQQATVAYVQAQRIGKQAVPVVKTIATGVAIVQIVLALFLTVIDIGLVAAAYSEARFFSHIVSFFLSYPGPSAQGAGNSFAGFANTMLLFVEIVGIGVAVAGVLGASTVLLALIRAYHRRPAYGERNGPTADVTRMG